MTPASEGKAEARWEEMLERRRKEMELPVYFARQVVEELGKERGLEILGHAFERYLEDTISKRMEGVPLEKRLERWGELSKRSAQEMPGVEVLTCTDKEVAMKITRCASAQIFAENGLAEVCRRYCDADFPTAKFIHPEVRLVRTKALAYGDDYCDHRYILEE